MATNYRYCPLCATPLVEELRFDQMRPLCPRCGFVHFRDPKVAVIGLVLHEDRVLLARRAVDPAKGKWALPGGYMDAGEMPEEALQRELLEEVGLAVRVIELVHIYPMADGEGQRIGIVLAYRAEPAAAPDRLNVGDDVAAAGWFGPDSLPETLAFASTRSLIAEWVAGGRRRMPAR